MNNPLVFIDSGSGGLSTLSSLLRIKNYDILYFADNKFAPYGNLTKKQIKNRIKNIISALKLRFNPIGFVLACNTATTTAIPFIRNLFRNEVFIGTEPATKLALKLGFKSPILIATPQTAKHVKYKKGITNIPLKDFAKDVEQFLTNKSILSIYKLLKDIHYIKARIKKNDCLVLGCTHYVIVKSIIEKFINIPIIDGNDGVAHEICRKFPNIYNNSNDKHNIKFVFSKIDNQLNENYKKILNQILANQINLC